MRTALSAVSVLTLSSSVTLRLLAVVTELGVGGSGVAYVRVWVGPATPFCVTVRLLIVPVEVDDGVAVELIADADASNAFVMKGLDCFDRSSLIPRCMIDVSMLTSAGSASETVKTDGDGRKNVLSYPSLTLGEDPTLL